MGWVGRIGPEGAFGRDMGLEVVGSGIGWEWHGYGMELAGVDEFWR